MIFTIVFLGFIVLSVLLFIYIFNRLVKLANQFKNAYAQIDVQLKRRYDLIPNLVDSAKAYLKHEKETLEAVMTARNAAFKASQAMAKKPGNDQLMQNLEGLESNLSMGLNKLMAVVESYPELKANQTIQNVMEELLSTENRISFARQAYNDSAMAYNTYRETFPNVLVASLSNHAHASPFRITQPKEKQAPKVAF